jgi:hypothetical protein
MWLFAIPIVLAGIMGVSWLLACSITGYSRVPRVIPPPLVEPAPDAFPLHYRSPYVPGITMREAAEALQVMSAARPSIREWMHFSPTDVQSDPPAMLVQECEVSYGE